MIVSLQSVPDLSEIIVHSLFTRLPFARWNVPI